MERHLHLGPESRLDCQCARPPRLCPLPPSSSYSIYFLFLIFFFLLEYPKKEEAVARFQVLVGELEKASSGRYSPQDLAKALYLYKLILFLLIKRFKAIRTLCNEELVPETTITAQLQRINKANSEDRKTARESLNECLKKA